MTDTVTADTRTYTLSVLAWVMAAGVVAIGAYASGVSSISTFSISILMAGAAVTLGALAGFVFGIPKTTAVSGAVDTRNDGASYQPNTNLEQISDWLTKILVGAGLTQLAGIPQGIRSLAEFAADNMNPKASCVFTGSIVLFFFVTGFLFGFLWTRLFLAGAFRRSDRELRQLVEKTLGAMGTFEQQLDETGKRTLESLRFQSERTLAHLTSEKEARKMLDPLAAEYEQVRRAMAPGTERTVSLTTTFTRMRALAQKLSATPDNVEKVFNHGSEGYRIAAIASAQVNPDIALLDLLFSAVNDPRSAFEQYQALLAIEPLLPKLNEVQKKQMIEVITAQWQKGNIGQGTDRKRIVERILGKLGAAVPE